MRDKTDGQTDTQTDLDRQAQLEKADENCGYGTNSTMLRPIAARSLVVQPGVGDHIAPLKL